MKILLKLLSIYVFLFLPTCLYAAADSYYVTQYGKGARNGKTLSDAWSASDFNNPSNWSTQDNFDKIDPGDTVFFSGSITSELSPKGNGTPDKYITFDGYIPGNYDAISESSSGQAVITRTQSRGQYCFALWDSSYGIMNGKDYLIIQDFEMKEFHVAVYMAEDSDHIIIRRNFMHDGARSGVWGTTSGGSNGNSYVTVGGKLGDGNSIKNTGTNTSGGDINFGNSNNIIISYNHLYATKSSGLPTDRGIDGVIFNHDSYDCLIEYNSIHGHQDNYGEKGEDGIDLKDDNLPGGSHHIIVRYNHIYDNRVKNINVNTAHHIYIYGNRMHDSNTSVYEHSRMILDEIFIFSNIIYHNSARGILVGGKPGSDTYIFNNTIAESGYDPDKSVLTGITITSGTDTDIYNNIFYKNRPNDCCLQIYVDKYRINGMKSDYNRYYFPSRTPTISLGDLKKIALSDLHKMSLYHEKSSTEGDPGLVDIDNNDYRIDINSDVIGKGLDMGTGTIVTIKIQGNNYPVYWDVALGPNTDWSGIIPVIELLRRDIVGWDLGAYAHSRLQPSVPSPPSKLRITD